jgi:hypothetical protein
MVHGEHDPDRPAVGPSHHVRGASIELPNEGGEIVSGGCHRKRGPVVRPRAGAEVALGRRDEPIPLRHRLALAFPVAVIACGTVDEYHRYPVPLFHIRKIDAIHPRMLDLRGGTEAVLIMASDPSLLSTLPGSDDPTRVG